MKNSSVTKCIYCGFTFTHESFNLVHQDYCSFNPVNKSCESCLYCNHKDYKLKLGKSVEIKSCFINQINYVYEVSHCLFYEYINSEGGKLLIKKAKFNYDPKPALRYALEKLGMSTLLFDLDKKMNIIYDVFKNIYIANYMIMNGSKLFLDFLTKHGLDINNYKIFGVKYLDLYKEFKDVLITIDEILNPDRYCPGYISCSNNFRRISKYPDEIVQFITNGRILLCKNVKILREEYSNSESKYFENKLILSILLILNPKTDHLEKFDIEAVCYDKRLTSEIERKLEIPPRNYIGKNGEIDHLISV